MKAIVTGGLGFIGSHLVERLLSEGWQVTIIDNLSTGSLENIKDVKDHPALKLVIEDLKNPKNLKSHFKDADTVFHFAANPEVKTSVEDPQTCFNENLVATFNVLEACRKSKNKTVVFASSSTVYGEPSIIPTPEDYHPLKPISIYGASKLACEELIETYSRLYGVKTLILRYANIIGPRLSRGVVVDFLRKLKANPKQLEILGDGTQRKSYLYIDDAVEATIKTYHYIEEHQCSEETFNVGSEDWITVKEIADLTVKELGLKDVEYQYKPATPDGRGWPGDVKLMLLDVSKLKRKTGWRPKHGSKESVIRTLKKLIKPGS